MKTWKLIVRMLCCSKIGVCGVSEGYERRRQRAGTKSRTELSKSNGKVYVYLRDEVIARRFLKIAWRRKLRD